MTYNPYSMAELGIGPDDVDESEPTTYDPREDDPAELAARAAYLVQLALEQSAELKQMDIERRLRDRVLPVAQLDRIAAILDEEVA